jgi:hypothetical protein
MEDYIKKLLTDPLHADTDEFLKYHNIDGPKALSILTKRVNPEDKNSAVIIKTTKIKDNGVNKDGKRVPDSFTIQYKAPRKNYTRKMRNLYISLFESNIIKNSPLNEEGEGGGATSADASGAFIQPLGEPIKRKRNYSIYITQEQEDYIKNVLKEESVMDTQAGNFGFDAPIGDGKKNNNNEFFADANDHKNIMKKSWPK